MALAKKIFSASIVQSSLAFLASLYIRLVYHTTRWERVNFQLPESYLKNKQPFLTCFWHSRLLLLPYAWVSRTAPFYMLISAHKDGRLISKTVGHFGIHTIAGSTNRGGKEALLHMVRLSRQGVTLGITPDGPRGPAFEVSDGTVMAAYLMKTDLLPVTYTVSRKKFFNSWDRFLFPLPFSRGVLGWGKAVPFPKNKEDFEQTKQQLKNALLTLSEEAEKYVADAL